MVNTPINSKSFNSALRTITLFNLLIAAQLLVALIYGVVSTDGLGDRFTHFLIPFVWITAASWVLWQTKPSATRRRYQIIAAAVAGGYLLILLYFSGLIGPSTTHLELVIGPSGFGVDWGQSLGWGPILLYTGNWVAIKVIPYQLIGYFALSYLVYDAMLDFARSAVGGVIGLAACPVCTGPLIGLLLAGGSGGSSTVLLVGLYAYEIATVLFVGTVALLYHRYKLMRLLEHLRARKR